MPAPVKRKRDIGDDLLLCGAQLAVSSAGERESKRLRATLTLDADGDESVAPFYFEVANTETVFNIALCILVAARRHSAECQCNSSRRPYNQIPRCKTYFSTALQWPDRWFRHTFRMSHDTFDSLVFLLEQNPIFRSTGKKPQRPVRYQLAALLMRYSVCGGDAMLAAKQLAIGLGSVFLYCRRVVRALRELGLDVLTWGDNVRHEEVSQYIHDNYGFPDCIGIVDGSLIRLTAAPKTMGLVYYCRKKYPALNIQAVVDHDCCFISFDMGWPGSVPDVSVWKQSRLWSHRRDYFSGEQYILADKGYPSSPYTLRPFTEPELDAVQGEERTRRVKFNQLLSSIRIRVEHAFGRLKARFPALYSLTPADDIQDTYRTIHAMMVLHNLCIDLDDHPTDFPDQSIPDFIYDEPDIEVPSYGGPLVNEPAEIPAEETDAWLRRKGHEKRIRILDYVLPRQ